MTFVTYLEIDTNDVV